MRRKHRHYDPDFRRKIVELVHTGRTVRAVSTEFGVSYATVHGWVRQSEVDTRGPVSGITTDEKTELEKLRRENARLREERDILKKAAAWFAQESVLRKPTDS